MMKLHDKYGEWIAQICSVQVQQNPVTLKQFSCSAYDQCVIVCASVEHW